MAVGSISLIDELQHLSGKAEIVAGRIVRMSPASAEHGDVSGEIFFSLKRHEKEHGGGVAYGDNVGFVVSLPNRKSFSPDAAWVHATRRQRIKKFWPGAPAFAVEVRSPEDSEPAGEKAIAEKIADYFAAGTLVVWNVGIDDRDVIRCYHASDPVHPRIFRRGELADAEPAVLGWKFAVDELFP
jgi:Uma2 family endonuclease